MLVLEKSSNDDKRIARFKRNVLFNGCFHIEESYLMGLEKENYYYCAGCRQFRKIKHVYG